MEPAVAPLPVESFPTADLSGGTYWNGTGTYYAPYVPTYTTTTTTTPKPPPKPPKEHGPPPKH